MQSKVLLICDLSINEKNTRDRFQQYQQWSCRDLYQARSQPPWIENKYHPSRRLAEFVLRYQAD